MYKRQPVEWGEGVMEYEKYLGFDPVRRIHFVLPFRRFEEKVVEKTEKYVIKQDIYGRQVIKHAGSELELDYKPVIETEEDWKKLKDHGNKELEKYFSDEQIEAAYAPLKMCIRDSYLVMETDVSGAYVMKEGKPVPVSITGSRNPFVTVSYTHLDVYKRQCYGIPE